MQLQPKNSAREALAALARADGRHAVAIKAVEHLPGLAYRFIDPHQGAAVSTCRAFFSASARILARRQKKQRAPLGALVKTLEDQDLVNSG
jgi:hypothetical protein